MSDTVNVDVVVLGSGVAGGVAATICREAGRSVVLTDPLPYGGTCPLRGCEPKKVLFEAAACVARVAHQQQGGISGRASIDWKRLMAFKRTFTEPVPESKEKSLRRAGVETLHEAARFSGKRELEIGGRHYRAEKILIGTGASPSRLSFAGWEHMITSDDFLELEDLPAHVVFVGGGYISFEFAHVTARAGAAATILHRSERPLKAFDPELVGMCVEATRLAGVDVRLDTPVSRIEKTAAGFEVHTGHGPPVRCDLVVHGAGRDANVADLNLEAAGVEYSAGGVRVDRFGRTSNPHVYAAGDCVETGWALTPVALMQATAAARNMVRGDSETIEREGVPAAVFTIPVLARAGALEAELRERGVKFEKNSGSMADWSPVRRLGLSHAGYKLLFDPDTDRVLGFHILGPHAEEVAGVFGLAIQQQITRAQLRQTVWPYPAAVYEMRHML